MESFLNSELPWQLKMLALLSAGLLQAVLLLAIPNRMLVRIGQIRGLSPNCISIWRVLIFWIGLYIYFKYSFFWGFTLVVLGCILDVIDGRMAKAYEKLGVFRSESDKALGKIIDPSSDKLTSPPALLLIALLSHLSIWISAAIVAVDAFGTIIRHMDDVGVWLVKLGPGYRKAGDRLIMTHARVTRHVKATSVGKIKALMQCFCLIASIPYQQGWVNDTDLINTMWIFTLALGFLSVFSRLYIHKTLDSFVDWITDKFFSHVDFRDVLRTFWQKA